jgi:hypothetical protein
LYRQERKLFINGWEELPRAVLSCELAYARGELPLPWHEHVFPMAFRRRSAFSFRGKCLRAASFSSRRVAPGQHCYRERLPARLITSFGRCVRSCRTFSTLSAASYSTDPVGGLEIRTHPGKNLRFPSGTRYEFGARITKNRLFVHYRQH